VPPKGALEVLPKGPKGALAVPPMGKISPVVEEQAGIARGASQESTQGSLVPPKGALWRLPREH